MPATLRTLSQSSLQDYTDCPRRFQLRYIEQLNYPAIESEPTLENEKHQQEGEYFHRLVQQHLIGIPAEQVGKLANTENLSRWWGNYLHARLPINDYAKYAEITLSAPLGPFRLVAKYDLVAVKDGRALIVDWKTYRKRPKNEWIVPRWQTRVYRALLTVAGSHLNGGQPFGPEQVEMIYWFADFPSEPANFPYTAAQFQRDWDALVKVAEEIAAGASFPQTEERQKCNYCPYRGYCDRGVRAGDIADAEVEMEAEELFDVNFEQIGEIAF
jgi:CRISPR/Cas system-associated exonuclease Cas4 (RecB family)